MLKFFAENSLILHNQKSFKSGDSHTNQFLSVISRLMSKKWGVEEMSSPFPCSPVIRECSWKKTQIEKNYSSNLQIFDDSQEVRFEFLDIPKDFHKVWHKGLNFKLKHISISGNLLRTFTDFLKLRQQSVVLNGQLSPWSNIQAGVQQVCL